MKRVLKFCLISTFLGNPSIGFSQNLDMQFPEVTSVLKDLGTYQNDLSMQGKIELIERTQQVRRSAEMPRFGVFEEYQILDLQDVVNLNIDSTSGRYIQVIDDALSLGELDQIPPVNWPSGLNGMETPGQVISPSKLPTINELSIATVVKEGCEKKLLIDGRFIPLATICEEGSDSERLGSDVSGFIGFHYSKNGFNHTVAVAATRTTPDEHGNVIQPCSGVLIHPKFVITAAHCLARTAKDFEDKLANKSSGPISGWQTIKFKHRYRQRVRVNHQFDDASNVVHSELLDVSKIYTPATSVDIHTMNTKDHPPSQKRASFARDIAILELKAEILNRDSFSFPKISLARDKNRRITLSGYGFTISEPGKQPDGRKWSGHLLVTANWISNTDSQFYHWVNDKSRGGSAPCSRDSGGPIFDGHEHGIFPYPMKVIGLTSNAEDPNPQVGSKCEFKKGSLLKLANFSAAICAIVEGTSVDVCTLLSTVE